MADRIEAKPEELEAHIKKVLKEVRIQLSDIEDFMKGEDFDILDPVYTALVRMALPQAYGDLQSLDDIMRIMTHRN